jgi:hypothetical protein
MFVRDFLYIDQPYEVLSPRFATSTARFAELMVSALTDLLQLDPGEGVACEFGEPRQRRDGVALPLWWAAPGGGLPCIDGEVSLARFERRSELALDGTYRRGSAIPERAAQRRVEECTRRLLHAFAAELERAALRSEDQA